MIEKEIEELLGDMRWCMNNLYWITNENGEITRFRMKPEQEYLFDNLWTRNDVLKARQLGISTFVAILILHLTLFNRNHRAGIIDKAIDDAQDKLDKIKFAYDHLDYIPDNATEIDLALAEIGAAVKQRISIVKRNDRYLTFSNRSLIKVGTSMRGGTVQFLHISELGHVSAHYPKRAREIRSGAINSVSKNCCVIKESTHEGGKDGVNYEITKNAMDMIGRELSPIDFRFFFFPWWTDPKYEVHDMPLKIDKYLADYFQDLEQQGIVLSDAKKVWYAAQWRQNGFDTFQEYPSTPEEALNVPIEGAIYGYAISALRAKGHINCDFEHDRMMPLYVSWDIGLGDNTALWLFQKAGLQLHILDHYQANELPADHFIQHIRKWESQYGPISAHLLPHDANSRNKTDAKSYADVLREAQLGLIKVVRRTPDIWVGINETRMLLPNCVFHARCSEKIVVGGVEYPSGIECLENYHKKANGQIDHDRYSHSADAFRMIAEAREQGLIEGVQSSLRRKSGLARTGRGAGWR